MKKVFCLIIFLIIYFKGISQCTFKDYEKYISENCFNCNQAEINKLVRKKCLESDSIIDKNEKRFREKVANEFQANSMQKMELKKIYQGTIEELRNSRKKILKNYNNLTKDGNNNYYIFLFYWYYTDKIIEILNDIETNIFGE